MRAFSPLNVFERFEKAKMVDVYRSIYALGSSEVHGDFSALLRHHVDGDPNNYHISIYKMRSEAEFIAEIDSIVRCLLDSTIHVHERFKSKHLEAIRKFDEVVRAELSTEPTG